MKATTQKVGAVLRKTSLPKGGWSASGRVSGWGRWIEGWHIEGERDEWYVCRICYGRSNHRFTDGRMNPRCGSGTWRKRSEQTGRVFVRYSEGEHTPRHARDEALPEMVAALTAAGLPVARDGDQLVVGEEEQER